MLWRQCCCWLAVREMIRLSGGGTHALRFREGGEGHFVVAEHEQRETRSPRIGGLSNGTLYCPNAQGSGARCVVE